MSATERRYVTEAEFMARPDREALAELLDGEVIVSPSATTRHQLIVGELFLVLRDWARAHPGHTVLLSPLDTRFGVDRILQPDVFVVAAAPGELDFPVRHTPALCVEVLSSRPDYDRRTKRLVYGQAGVPEYWVIDPDGGAELFHGDGLVQRIPCSDRIDSHVLDGLTVDLTDLLA
jgi:Uma2 family endonuclease